MRHFHFETAYRKLLTPEVVSYLVSIHEFRERQELFMEGRLEALSGLVTVAKMQSTDSSNRIEGIVTTDERLRKLVCEKTSPKNRNEQEIAGYRDVLATIHESYAYIEPKVPVILQLHRDLCRFTSTSVGGRFKNADNVIAQVLPNGKKIVRFEPLAAWETPQAVEELCQEYRDAVKTSSLDSLLLIPMFILDFLCIHPFSDGNGRMSRLLTLLLLYRAGFLVGQYVSIEKIICATKDSYYEALRLSSFNWHEGKNDYAPFVTYMLGTILAAYREFENRLALVKKKGCSKSDRVREAIRNQLGKITKSEIVARCPDISQITVQRTLANLMKSREIKKLGNGRYAAYVWIGEK